MIINDEIGPEQQQRKFEEKGRNKVQMRLRGGLEAMQRGEKQQNNFKRIFDAFEPHLLLPKEITQDATLEQFCKVSQLGEAALEAWTHRLGNRIYHYFIDADGNLTPAAIDALQPSSTAENTTSYITKEGGFSEEARQLLLSDYKPDTSIDEKQKAFLEKAMRQLKDDITIAALAGSIGIVGLIGKLHSPKSSSQEFHDTFRNISTWNDTVERININQIKLPLYEVKLQNYLPLLRNELNVISNLEEKETKRGKKIYITRIKEFLYGQVKLLLQPASTSSNYKNIEEGFRILLSTTSKVNKNTDSETSEKDKTTIVSWFSLFVKNFFTSTPAQAITTTSLSKEEPLNQAIEICCKLYIEFLKLQKEFLDETESAETENRNTLSPSSQP